MPYDDPNNQPIGPELEEGVLMKETFASNFGEFTVVTTKGYGWAISHSTATGTGYQNGTNQESESYLISPEIDLSEVEAAHIEFEYIMAYMQNAGDDKVLITSEYNEEDPASSVWNVVEETASWKAVANGDWNTFTKYRKNIPGDFIGKKIRIAFYFTGLDKSKTWEIKNVYVREGEGVEQNGDPVEPLPEGTYFYETFSQDFGSFTTKKAIEDGYDWFISYNCAQGTGFQNKANKPSKSFLVSPEVDLSNSENAYLKLEYQLNTYGNEGKNRILVTDEYTGDATTTRWYDITGELATVSAWNWDLATTYNKGLPTRFLGKKIRVAFYFEAGEKSQTWEIRNVLLCEGEPDEGYAQISEEFILEEPVNRGSYDAPLSVAEALSLQDVDDVWVEGYIVGNFENNTFLPVGNNKVKSNIAISDNPQTQSSEGVMPVMLARAQQASLNIVDNASLAGRRVVACGKIGSYLGTIGLRELKYIETEGNNGPIVFGNK